MTLKIYLYLKVHSATNDLKLHFKVTLNFTRASRIGCAMVWIWNFIGQEIDPLERFLRVRDIIDI